MMARIVIVLLLYVFVGCGALQVKVIRREHAGDILEFETYDKNICSYYEAEYVTSYRYSKGVTCKCLKSGIFYSYPSSAYQPKCHRPTAASAGRCIMHNKNYRSDVC